MPIYYNEDEYNKLLSVTKNEHDVIIPNEFFDDIITSLNIDKEGCSSKHVSFAYSYLYLITYLYRYAKFHENDDYSFTEQELKKLLTMSPVNKGKNNVNYISKRNGILEQMGYIEKVKDYPVGYDYDVDNKEFVFSYLSEIIDDLGENASKYFNVNSKNRRVNLPVKMLNDREIAAINIGCNGTLYDVSYTTNIDIRVFVYCMVREKLGLEAFYLYSFIKFKNNCYKDFWKRSIEGIIEDTGIGQSVVQSRLKEMEKHGMLICSHEDYVIGSTKEGMVPNSYMIRDHHMFIRKNEAKLEYKRGRVISLESYLEKNNEFIGDLPEGWN